MDATLSMSHHQDIADLAQAMKSRGDAFVIATVVRTVSVTAAKPGAKAIIDQHGNIVDGWIGGGCARHAVLKAAVESIKDGKALLVSIQPEELLEEQNDQQNLQVISARNLCPSQGSMDIFLEPVLALPVLLVIGSSPVAQALAQIGSLFDFNVVSHAVGKQPANVTIPAVAPTGKSGSGENSVNPEIDHPHRYIVVSTQGSGDRQALEFALSLQARYIGFVGSSRKIKHLQSRLGEAGLDEERLKSIKCPAGLSINALTPQEIALSILAEIVQLRRS